MIQVLIDDFEFLSYLYTVKETSFLPRIMQGICNILFLFSLWRAKYVNFSNLIAIIDWVSYILFSNFSN